MRLASLNPRWAVSRASRDESGITIYNADRTGMGMTFDCPHCKGATRLGIFFANPIDGKEPALDARHLWERSGETFETLTLSPSIDASSAGHWHGFITNGEIT